jgi:hypothetical protein
MLIVLDAAIGRRIMPLVQLNTKRLRATWPVGSPVLWCVADRVLLETATPPVFGKENARQVIHDLHDSFVSHAGYVCFVCFTAAFPTIRETPLFIGVREVTAHDLSEWLAEHSH